MNEFALLDAKLSFLRNQSLETSTLSRSEMVSNYDFSLVLSKEQTQLDSRKDTEKTSKCTLKASKTDENSLNTPVAKSSAFVLCDTLDAKDDEIVDREIISGLDNMPLELKPSVLNSSYSQASILINSMIDSLTDDNLPEISEILDILTLSSKGMQVFYESSCKLTMDASSANCTACYNLILIYIVTINYVYGLRLVLNRMKAFKEPLKNKENQKHKRNITNSEQERKERMERFSAAFDFGL
ncbi:MAG: hypothetical protein ACI4M9_02045 [Succinivibrio sp.]